MKSKTKKDIMFYSIIVLFASLLTTYLRFINTHLTGKWTVVILFTISLILTIVLYGIVVIFGYGFYMFDEFNEEID